MVKIKVNSTKKEHFVPRCYLCNFSSDDCGKKSEKQVLVYNKINKKKYVSRIYDVACENYFYDLDNPKNAEEKLIIEIMLGQIETKFSNLLNKFINICQNKENINSALITTKEERKEFSYYIVIQLMRTKKIRKTLKDACQNIFNKRLEFYKEYKKNRFNENININIGDIFINGKIIHLGALFDEDLINTLSFSIFNSYWTFLYDNTSVPFIISDNPVCRIPLLYKCEGNSKIELSNFMSNMLEINFPLNDKIALHIYMDDTIFYKKYGKFLNNRLILIKEEEVIHCLNKYQCIMADERVFFRCEDTRLIERYFSDPVMNKKYLIF